MATTVSIEEFLKLSEAHPILDVRTPAEFAQGHIPGAINLPLFSDEERKVIGTLYKQEGKQTAILKGLELVGPKLHTFLSEASKIENSGTFLFHCWRGGMRSGSMAWLFETYGFKTIVLKGGYKKFRTHVLESFNTPKKLVILGGKTGSGKTLILHELGKQGEQILDLERTAHHKGSSFGAFGEEKQLSQEQFENELSMLYTKLDPLRRCWVEDESRKIGINMLPEALWTQMRNTKVICIDLAIEARTNYLVEEYGKFSKEDLKAAIQRIGKRLGGQHVKRALEAIEADDLRTACEISLVYYDQTYSFGLSQRDKEKIIHIPFETMDIEHIVQTIREK